MRNISKAFALVNESITKSVFGTRFVRGFRAGPAGRQRRPRLRCLFSGAGLVPGLLAVMASAQEGASGLGYEVPVNLRVSVVAPGSLFSVRVELQPTIEAAGAAFAKVKALAPKTELLIAIGDSMMVRVDDLGLEALAKAGFRLSGIKTSPEGSVQTEKSELDAGVIDSDGDGLTDTEERWWGTNPYNADTDGDGVSDSKEIRRARAGDHSAGVPWPDWPKWGQALEANSWIPKGLGLTNEIIDLDMDCIPDAAERFVLGFNAYRESTDNDRYDDGQEFWGITQLGRGALPRAVDSDFLLAEMPNFVDPPGNSPLCAAYPDIKVRVIGDTISVITRQVISTTQRQINERETTYDKEVTEENSVESLSETTLRHLEKSAPVQQTNAPMEIVVRVENPSAINVPGGPDSGENPLLATADLITAYGSTAISEGKAGYQLVKAVKDYVQSGDVCDLINGGKSSAESYRTANEQGRVVINKLGSALTGFAAWSPALLGSDIQPIVRDITGAYVYDFENMYDLVSEPAMNKLDRSLKDAYNANNCDDQALSTGRTYVTDGLPESTQGSPAASHPIPAKGPGVVKSSETEKTQHDSVIHRHSTKVRARTTERILSRSEWSEATTTDTAHAADLSFDLEIGNDGTDVVRKINSIWVNVYIGDSTDVAYTVDLLGDLSSIDKINNLFPGVSFRINTPVAIPLTLDQTKKIDLGEPLRIVVSRIEYGDDQLFYENAFAGGVLVQVDDGIDDNTEDLKPFLVPTWGTETYLQVMDRITDVLKLDFDADSNLRWIDVPVFNSQHRIVRLDRLPNSKKGRWLIFHQSTNTAAFTDLPATPETLVLLKFYKDEDQDGFTDAIEARIGTDPGDSLSFPKPQLAAGYIDVSTNGNKIYTALAIENTGNYPATGVEAVMFSPTGSDQILANFTGGGGIILPGQRVVIGPRYLGPNVAGWTGTAKPLIGGLYTGTNEVIYSFTASSSGTVGVTSNLFLNVNWGAGGQTNLAIGAGYSTPRLLNVGSAGLQVGMNSGFVQGGQTFTVVAKPTLDCLVRLTNSTATSPAFALAYNSPRGSHRQTITKRLSSLAESLSGVTPLRGTSLNASLLRSLSPNTNNIIHLGAYCAENQISNALIHLQLIDATLQTSNIVWSQTITNTLTKGNNYTNLSVNPATMAPTAPLSPDRTYYLMTTLSDQMVSGSSTGGNIIDQVMRSVAISSGNTRTNATPNLSVSHLAATEVVPGERLQFQVTLANTGSDILEVLLPIGSRAISTSLPGNFARISPGQSLALFVYVDTTLLQSGLNQFALPLVFGNSATQTIVIPITADVLASTPGVKVVSVPQKPWSKLVRIPGPRAQGEVVPIDLPSDFNILDAFPISASELGSVIGNGPFTKLNNQPLRLWTNPYKPSRSFFKLHRSITSDEVLELTIDYGHRLSITNGIATSSIALTSAGVENFELGILPIQQTPELLT